MLKRMVIGLPRSGTTWAANWLTYDEELTAHDPLYHHHYKDWHGHPGFTGVSCTGIWRWPEFIKAQTCPILVLHRDEESIRKSLAKFDIQDKGSWLEPGAESHLWAIEGDNVHHADWTELFNPILAGTLWRHLMMPSQFDVRRHKELTRYAVQPLHPTPLDAPHRLYSRLMAELQEKAERAKNVV